ncbi:MAG: hypothetical protein SWX82_02115 [Cyanobacteriota bacterium]|nr:hypothetical protein [Cyanobacteriota bacterium]
MFYRCCRKEEGRRKKEEGRRKKEEKKVISVISYQLSVPLQ